MGDVGDFERGIAGENNRKSLTNKYLPLIHSYPRRMSPKSPKSTRSPDLIAHAQYGVDDSSFDVPVYFAAQAQYVGFDGVRKRIGVHVPNVLQQHASGKDRALVSQQVFEEHELFGSKVYFLLRAINRVRFCI